MSQEDPSAHVSRICGPVLESSGYELVEAVWRRHPRHPAVVLYVHKEGGVTIGDCECVMRMLDPLLRVEGVLDDRTAFEVASPGLDRPLHTGPDFRRALGYRVAVRLRPDAGAEDDKCFVGEVADLTPNAVTLTLEGGASRTIPLGEIVEGRFEIRF